MIKAQGEPLYKKIFFDLRNDIVSGKMNPKDMLPSENELADKYETTRATVRKSLQGLENQGLVYSRPGKGYFVSKPVHNLFMLDFTEEESEKEITYKNINVIKADEEMKGIFGPAVEKAVIEISRVIKNAGVPVAYDMKYLPYEKGTPLIENEINYAVFPNIIAAKEAPFAFYTKMDIRAQLPTRDVAKALKCSEAEPMLVVCRYFMDRHDRCIGYGKKYMRSQYGGMTAQSGYHYEK